MCWEVFLDLSHSGLLEDDMQNLWDDFWKKSNVKDIDSWSKRRAIQIISDYVKSGKTVLDAGCGSGFFSSYFISCGCDVYSLDYSEEALLTTKRVTGHRSRMYMRNDILNGGILSGIRAKFDIIFTDGLLEHYSNEEQDKIIRNMTALKKEGVYIINFVPNRFSFWSMIRPFYMNIKESPFTISEFLNLHTRNSLDIIRFGGINVLPFKISPERLLGRHFGMLHYCIAV